MQKKVQRLKKLLEFYVHIVFHSGKWWNQKVLLSDSHMLCTFS